MRRRPFSCCITRCELRFRETSCIATEKRHRSAQPALTTDRGILVTRPGAHARQHSSAPADRLAIRFARTITVQPCRQPRARRAATHVRSCLARRRLAEEDGKDLKTADRRCRRLSAVPLTEGCLARRRANSIVPRAPMKLNSPSAGGLHIVRIPKLARRLHPPVRFRRAIERSHQSPREASPQFGCPGCRKSVPSRSVSGNTCPAFSHLVSHTSASALMDEPQEEPIAALA